MNPIPVGPAPASDLDRNASIYRAAVARPSKSGVDPFSFLIITLLVTVVFAAILAFTGYQLSQVRIGPQLISKLAGPPPPATAKAVLIPSRVMPNGPAAFAK